VPWSSPLRWADRQRQICRLSPHSVGTLPVVRPAPAPGRDSENPNVSAAYNPSLTTQRLRHPQQLFSYVRRQSNPIVASARNRLLTLWLLFAVSARPRLPPGPSLLTRARPPCRAVHRAYRRGSDLSGEFRSCLSLKIGLVLFGSFEVFHGISPNS